MHAVLFGLTIARVTHADRMSRIHLALAGLFFVLAAPLQINDAIYYGIAWILKGAVFTAIGLHFVDRQMLATALIVFGLALLRLFLFDYGSPAQLIAGTAIDLRFFLIAASGVVTMITGTMPWWIPQRQLANLDESEDQASG